MPYKKHCIFHIPNKIDEVGSSGSQVRPRKMIAAFREIGYEVDVVMGYGKERKKSIKDIKKKISEGIKYDFLYSESSTMPTLLTEKNHLPCYPNLDFGFFKYCKRNHIPIGLFYRDIHWRFPDYKKNIHGVKYMAAIAAYKYDLLKYAQLIDVFYVSNKKINRYVRNKKLFQIMEELLPGSEYNVPSIEEKRRFFEGRKKESQGKLSLFYVGGLGGHYVFSELLKGVKKHENIEVTICCREKEWRENKDALSPHITERVHIVHKFGKDLLEFYKEADICLAFFKPDLYMEMAMPIKLFEYLSYTIPVLASKKTAVGRFVAENGIGWSIDYSAKAVERLFERLSRNYQEIYNIHLKEQTVLEHNLWISRAAKAAEQLSLF